MMLTPLVLFVSGDNHCAKAYSFQDVVAGASLSAACKKEMEKASQIKLNNGKV
jgi:hypothetical protein